MIFPSFNFYKLQLLHGIFKTNYADVNPFFAIVPAPYLVPAIVLATAASIIASQALISGSFTLINEAISLGFWPRINVKYPSNIRGQIYIPSINWILFTGCALVLPPSLDRWGWSSHKDMSQGWDIPLCR